MDLLRGRTAKHRSQVFVDIAANDEATVRDDRWKLIYERGQRRRTDGYDTGRPLPGRKIPFYDLQSDPHELHDVASLPANADRVHSLLHDLAATSSRPLAIRRSFPPRPIRYIHSTSWSNPTMYTPALPPTCEHREVT